MKDRPYYKSRHRDRFPKTSPLSARLSAEAKAGLLALANEAGVSLSEYLELLGLTHAVNSGQITGEFLLN